MRGASDEEKVQLFTCTDDQRDCGLHAFQRRVRNLVQVVRIGRDRREGLGSEQALPEGGQT